MKRLSISLALILITLASFVSAASLEPKNKENPALSETKEEPPGQKKKQQGEQLQQSSESVKPNSPHSEKDNSNEDAPRRWYSFLWDTTIPNWLVIVGWTIATFIAGAALIALNRQVRENIRAANATIQAADAAVDNKKVARLALNAERPFIFIPNPYVETGKFNPSDEQAIVAITYRLQNFGTGPALIRSIRSKIVVAENVTSDTQVERIIALSEGHTIRISGKVIGGEKKGPDETAWIQLNTSIWKEIIEAKLSLIIVCLVTYTDVFKTRYHTMIPFWHYPLRARAKKSPLVWEGITSVLHEKYEHRT